MLFRFAIELSDDGGLFCFWQMFDAICFGYDNDTVFAYLETTCDVLCGIVADLYAGWDLHSFIDDGSSYFRVSPDSDIFKEN